MITKRTGEKLETKYSVTPTPPKPLDKEIQNKVDIVNVELEKLLAGLDPFGFEPTSEEEAKTS